jgi:flagellar hook-associated protein 2
MTSSVDGLVSGLNTTDIITKLMAAEKAPQDRLLARHTQAKNVVKAYQSLNAKLAALRDASGALAGPAGWAAMKATSSAPGVATATASAGALGSSLTFTVNRLATASSIISGGSVAATTAVVAGGPLLVSAGGAAIGVSTFDGGAGLALGTHTIKVTQASAGAAKSASTALATGSIVIGAGNDTLDVEVDGVAKTFTLANATYDATSLAAAVQTASGGDLKASIDSNGKLVLATVDEGSAATLRITGGTALTDLGLTGAEVGGAASVGTDGTFDSDGNVTTVTDVRAGLSVVLPGAGGNITAVLGSGMRVGSVTAKEVDTGDGSMSALINAVNNANVGVTASALQVVPGQLRLQLASASSGLAGAVSTATTSITGLGTFSSLGTAQDASITIGSGAGAFTVTSSTNQVSNVLTGVTLDLVSTGTATVTVGHDVDAIAAKVSGMVDQVNAVVKEIKAQTAFDPDTKTGGLLMGDFTVRQLQSNLVNSILDTVSTSTVGPASTLGISIDKTGIFSFDKGKFTTAYNADAAGVAAAFQRGGTAASSTVSLASATNKTRPGSYDVTITQAATQGTATGAVLGGGTIAGAETLDVRVGGATGTVVSYSAAAGSTLQSVADGLNQLLAQSALPVLASVSGSALVISSTGYGTNASFEVRSSTIAAGQTGIVAAANTWEPHTGTNVVGTINGVAATGIGRLLQAPPTDPSLAGLTLAVAATAAQVAGAGGTLDLGNFDYVPGIAQRTATVGTDATDIVSGTLTAAIDGHNSEIDDLQAQIESWDRRLADREAQLKQQFTAMETALSQMKQQSQWLAGQVNTLSANSNANK